MTLFEATNSAFNTTTENNKFSITTSAYSTSRGGAKTIIELRELLEFRTQNDCELHVEGIRKRRNQKKIGDSEYQLSDLDTRKNDIIEELKNVENHDLEDMVFRLGLTYTEILYI